MAAIAAPPIASMSFQSDDTVFKETSPWFLVGPGQSTGRLTTGHYICRSQRVQTTRKQFYRTALARDYGSGEACTGLRNTPIQATLTSPTSLSTSGPTPAGAPA